MIFVENERKSLRRGNVLVEIEWIRWATSGTCQGGGQDKMTDRQTRGRGTELTDSRWVCGFAGLWVVDALARRHLLLLVYFEAAASLLSLRASLPASSSSPCTGPQP